MGETALRESFRKTVRFGQFEVDLRSADFYKEGKRVRLDGQPFQVLAQLLARPGDLVTREELQKALWPNDTFVDFEHSINAAVKRLREALGDSAESPRFIETLPRRGYRFICPIEAQVSPIRLAAVSPHVREESKPVGIEVSPGSTGKRLSIRLLVPLVIVAGLVMIAYYSGFFGAGAETSLAVLQVRNDSGDPDKEYIADSLTDQLISSFHSIGKLRVPSIQSVLQFKGSKLPLPEIAKALDVEFVLESAFTIDEDSVQLTVRLVQVTPGPETVLWSQPTPFVAPIGKIFELHNSLARTVARKLRVTLTSREEARLARAREIDPLAYSEFIKAVGLFHQGTEEARKQASGLFQNAVVHDRDFTEAYAYAALLWAHGGKYLDGPAKLQRSTAQEYARQALDRDGDSVEAHTALGWLYMTDLYWDEAEEEYRSAIRLDPSFPIARTWYAQYLSAMCRFEEAGEQAKWAIKEAGNDSVIVTHAVVPYYEKGGPELDKAVKVWREVIARDPGYWGAHVFLARAHLMQGHPEDAIRELSEGSALRDGTEMGPPAQALMAYAYARAGRQDEALKLARSLEDRANTGKQVDRSFIALAFVGLNDTSKAMYWLNEGWERRNGGMFFINSDPLFKPLHDVSDFKKLTSLIFHPIDDGGLPKTGIRGSQCK